MKRNSKKVRGFTLIEVVIGIAILSIISIGVYDGCVIIAKQIKAGQIKQSAALEGKKIVEKMQATTFKVPGSSDTELDLGDDIVLEKNEDGRAFYIRYLDEKYNPCTEAVSKYVEKITLTNGNITLNDNHLTDELENTSNINYKVYLSKEENSSKTEIDDYIKDDTTDKILVPENDLNKILMYVYIETPSDSRNSRTITIKSFNGINLLDETEMLPDPTASKINLWINFDDYKQINSVPKLDNSDLKDVKIYVYNKTENPANIYLQKDNTVTADVKTYTGVINIYDNRAESANDSIGTLYNIKLEISDYLKYRNNEIRTDNDNLFTGYYKKNIE